MAAAGSPSSEPKLPEPSTSGYAQRERLRHADERLVDRGVAVRVVAAHHVADDLGALAVLGVGGQVLLPHRVEDAALHRLEAVAHVGQRARGDDRQRVVQVAALRRFVQRNGVGRSARRRWRRCLVREIERAGSDFRDLRSAVQESILTAKCMIRNVTSPFTTKTLSFLRALKRNNRREWFQPRKDEYRRTCAHQWSRCSAARDRYANVCTGADR